MHWRSHQQDLISLLDRHPGNPVPRVIGAHIACGGGKSALALIYAHYLKERLRLVDRVCIITPNEALREQMVEDSMPKDKKGQLKFIMRLLPHSLTLYDVANAGLNPSKDGSGYVTTYQSVACDKGELHRKEFDRRRYALILDEPHHLAIGGEYHKAMRPLIERAPYLLAMTGTLDRSDRKRIAVFPYGDDELVDTSPRSDFHWITYTIEQGMEEGAIIPTEVCHGDGRARWIKGGEEYEVETLRDDRDALYAALQTEYANQLLDLGSSGWLRWAKQRPRSKCLVVSSDVKQARRALSHLKGSGIQRVGIATYKEEAEAKTAIRQFKKVGDPDRLDVLVTVAKAYEGLDVPSITHLICLTHIRSRPWIEQMIARSWRHDSGESGTQRAFIFAPDDADMVRVLGDIRSCQQMAARDVDEDEPSPGDGSDQGTMTEGRPVLVALGGTLGSIRAADFNGDGLDPQTTMAYLGIIERRDLPISPLQLFEAVNDVRNIPAASPETDPPAWPDLMPSQRLKCLRDDLDAAIKSVGYRMAGTNRENVGEFIARINAEIRRAYGDREALTESQLRSARQDIGRQYGV